MMIQGRIISLSSALHHRIDRPCRIIDASLFFCFSCVLIVDVTGSVPNVLGVLKIPDSNDETWRLRAPLKNQTSTMSSNLLSASSSCWGDPTLILLGSLCFILLIVKLVDWHVFYTMRLTLEYLWVRVPLIHVEMTEAEVSDDGVPTEPSKNTELKNKSRPNFIQCYDPSTKQRLGEVVAMNSQDVHDLCEKAKVAQQEWSKTTFTQRRTVLRTIQRYILHHLENICRVCSRDSGKPKLDALLGEVMTTCEKIRTINMNGELWLQKSYRSTGPMMIHKSAYVEYTPLGVLGVIAPWNYPFHNLLNHVISGIFAGNAVVSKVSEHTSWSAEYFSRIVGKALEVHGHDANLVQVVTGFGEAGAALVNEPLVDKIIFTGSPGVGRLVMEGASKSLKPVILELGGKDPMVFVEDVNMKDVLPWAMRGCFQNCGQNCCGVERLFVYESIHDEFIDRVRVKVEALRQGVPLACCGSSGEVDCGSMVMDQQIHHIQALIDDAVKKGATLHCGGKRNAKLDGQFYEPTLISGVTSDMRISKEEVFGPVMCVIKVPNDDDEECVRMVNNCSFGLGSSVYAGNQARGVKIGQQIRSGMFTVNDFGVNYLIQSLPFGGVKESGFDRFAGPEGLRACCLERSMVVDRIPGVRTSIPSPIDYPIDQEKSLGFGCSLITLMYDESWLGKIKGIFGLIKNG
jgi:acyl-CoA reductase-like NAD-dependent aldehyde dehydrogenase